MDLIIALGLALAVLYVLRASQQQRRVALLGGFLSRYTIEKNIETVTQGYLRALDEADPARREQIWQLLRASEQELCRQVTQLAADFAGADPPLTRVRRFPLWLPFGPAFDASFDMREALRVHAGGICRAVESDSGTPRDRAYAISAELLLMQHTCHWYCRSKAVASARMLARHRTSYEQLVASVLPQTRSEYLALVSRTAA